jgi:ribosomal peptide maturation radical SAM protein 1
MKPIAVIIVPPFADPKMPVLGPSLLVAECIKKGIDCRILYANLILAAMATPDRYNRLCYFGDTITGDALFAPYAFDCDKSAIFSSLFASSGLSYRGGREERLECDEYLEADKLVPAFLESVMDRVNEMDPSIVGFSSTVQQTMASLAIASRIKRVHPETITVLGGANVGDPMGPALLEAASMIDFVFSGEADKQFPHFCYDYFHNSALPASRQILCPALDLLDCAEIPDYEEYYRQIRSFQDRGLLPPDWPELLLFESSRGCWWGDKCHCTFCGIDTRMFRYRQKSALRIAEELSLLGNKYDIGMYAATDNIMPSDIEESLGRASFPKGRPTFFYEIKPNCAPHRLDALVRAGVTRMQAGIETLSTPLLKKMKKGLSALQNLIFLRESDSRLIDVTWNFLVNVPGEQKEDYRHLVEILPDIEHLQAPTSWQPVRLINNSPYIDRPEEFGIQQIAPNDIYRLIYPAGTDYGKLAQHFQGTYPNLESSDPEFFAVLTGAIDRWVDRWKERDKRPRLYLTQTPSKLPVIRDTRSVARTSFTLLNEQSLQLLKLLDRPTRRDSISDRFAATLMDLIDRKFIIDYEGHFLSLVTNPLLGLSLRNSQDWISSMR